VPKNEGQYGAYGGGAVPGEEQFKPKGEPEKRDNRGTIEDAGVPGSPPSAGYPAEPDQPISKEPIGGLMMGETVRRATNEAVQPIDKPVANADITGGSAEARSVEPGV
jgi:hypothetical protein